MGRSWGAVQAVTGDASAAGERTDPGPVWHEKSKTLILHVGGASFGSNAGGSNETWQLTSTDRGQSWSTPRSLSAELGPAAGFRPIDGGLALSSGRLMMAGYGELGQPWPFAMKIDGVVAVWFSDDIGKSWKLAEVACSSPTLCNTTAKVFTTKITESVLAQLPGAHGGVVLDSRVDGAHLRRGAISLNPQSAHPLFDSRHVTKGLLLPDAGGNAGGLVAIDNALFYSNAIAANHGRQDMTVLRSDDRGASWTHGALVFPGYAAYSAMCTMANSSTVGLAYEREWNDTTVATGASSSIWWTGVPTDLPPFTPPGI
jgi:hypothetical protein